jgi:phage tail sheath gpL-like
MTNIPLASKATALAVGVSFEDFRTGAPSLQQRLYAIGQGATLVSYLNEKFTAVSSGEVGAKVGYGSPLHLMSKKIFPPDGKGAKTGAVEVTFFPLDDPAGAVAAEKTLDAVGTQTEAKTAVLRINDLRLSFVIPKDTDNDGVLAIIKDAIDAELSSPVTTAISAGSATSGRMITGVVTAAIAAWQAVTDGEFTVSVDGTPTNVTGLDFSLDASLADVASTIDTGLGVGATCAWNATTEKFTITSATTGESATISALSTYGAGVGTDISGSDFMNGQVDAATVVPGTDADNILTLTTKWAGADSDDLDIEVIQDQAGMTFIIENKTSGAGVGDVDPALAAMGTVWYTMLASQYTDSTNIGKIADKNELLWDASVNRFFVCGLGESDRTAAEAISDARKTDRTNIFGVADSCPAWNFEIGARNIAEICSRANLEPNRHYTGLVLSGLTPGSDADQPEYTEQDASLKKGTSTILSKDGVLKVGDMVTFYHPDNEQPDPGYQWVVDVVKLQNIVNSVRLKFSSSDWEGMTILADDDISTKATVRRPKDVKGAYYGLTDSWVQEAWITDADFTKENMVVAQNPSARNRFDATIPVKISDSLRIQDYTIKFGFSLA